MVAPKLSLNLKGACGYRNLYGLDTAALSDALFNGGSACCACYEIMCVNSPQWCISGAGTIKITATNQCPPGSTGGWCDPPQPHFDLTKPMFLKIAVKRGSGLPVKYRRVSCSRPGGVRSEINGNPNSALVLVYNVGGAGDLTGVQIKGEQTGWTAMSRDWGQNWECRTNLVGQSLSFRVTTSDGKTIDFDNVVPSSWKFGRTFKGTTNF